MDLETLSTIGSIILINLVLSGDNAIVIALAARLLPKAQWRLAILWGTLGAVLLRIFFTAVVFLLLSIPLVQLAGGLLLIWIAFKLLIKPPVVSETLRAGRSLWEAIYLIVAADAIMSLDNMLAVAAAARGHFELVVLGLALSIPLLMAGAGLIAQVMSRLPWLVWLGGMLIAWIAAEMVVDDPFLQGQLGGPTGPGRWASLAGITGLTLLISWLWGRRPTPAVSQSNNPRFLV